MTSGCYAINGVCTVQSLTATNTSLTVSPSTGAVGISLNLANPNLWTGLQQFGNATTSLLEATQFYARTIQSTSSNALILKSNLSSTAGLTFGSTSTPQVLGIDTINNRVTLGTGGGTPSLLVLDNKNTAGDPTGLAGAQYYNASTNEKQQFLNIALGSLKETVYLLEFIHTMDIKTSHDLRETRDKLEEYARILYSILNRS
jgi:hypothetical protein